MNKLDYLLYLVGIVIIGSLIGVKIAIDKMREHSDTVKVSQTVSDNNHNSKYTPVPILNCECIKVHVSGQFCERYQVFRLTTND